jgi:predicted GNAT family acetyltransferase
MKINEIINVYGGGIRIDRINRNEEQYLGKIENFEFYKTQNENLIIYHVVDNNEVVAAVAGIIVNKNEIYFQIKGTFVKESYRGNNLALKMYYEIKRIDNIRLMSDIEHSVYGKNLWNKLSKSFKVQVLDLNTDEIVSDNINDAYTDPNYVLITEQFDNISILIPTLKL